jgi:hypothetical protein
MKSWMLSMLVFIPSLAEARVPDWWRKAALGDHEDRDSDDRQTARLKTAGPIRLRLHAIAGDVEVVAGGDKQITVKAFETGGARISFREEGGDRVELLFNDAPKLRCGRLCVEVPAKSAIDVSSDTGDVVIHRIGGDVRARSVAGDVKVENAAAVDARSISGDVVVQNAQGEVRVETVSGDVAINTVGLGTRMQASTTSGDVSWSGSCGSGCRIEARTLSGDIQLAMADKSSFALHFMTHGGEVTDDFNLNLAAKQADSLNARYGSGDGIVEAQTFSGDLHLARAK